MKETFLRKMNQAVTSIGNILKTVCRCSLSNVTTRLIWLTQSDRLSTYYCTCLNFVIF